MFGPVLSGLASVLNAVSLRFCPDPPSIYFPYFINLELPFNILLLLRRRIHKRSFTLVNFVLILGYVLYLTRFDERISPWQVLTYSIAMLFGSFLSPRLGGSVGEIARAVTVLLLRAKNINVYILAKVIQIFINALLSIKVNKQEHTKLIDKTIVFGLPVINSTSLVLIGLSEHALVKYLLEFKDQIALFTMLNYESMIRKAVTGVTGKLQPLLSAKGLGVCLGFIAPFYLDTLLSILLKSKGNGHLPFTIIDLASLLFLAGSHLLSAPPSISFILNLDSLGLLIWEMFVLATSPHPSSLLLTRATWMLLNTHNLADNLLIGMSLASVAWLINTVYFNEQRMLSITQHLDSLTSAHGIKAKLYHTLSIGTNNELIKLVASGACLVIGVLLFDHYRLRRKRKNYKQGHQQNREIAMTFINSKED